MSDKQQAIEALLAVKPAMIFDEPWQLGPILEVLADPNPNTRRFSMERACTAIEDATGLSISTHTLRRWVIAAEQARASQTSSR